MARWRVWNLASVWLMVLLVMVGCGKPPAADGSGAPGAASTDVISTIREAFHERWPGGRGLSLEGPNPGAVELPLSGLFVLCRGAKGKGSDELPLVLACQWGPGANMITGHGLFWPKGNRWYGQPYPAGKAREVPGVVPGAAPAKRPGAPCGANCGSGFSAIRQEGRRLGLVVNLFATGTFYAEEVHLLERGRSGWRVVWQPAPGSWRYFHSRVAWVGDGLTRFRTTAETSRPPDESRQVVRGFALRDGAYRLEYEHPATWAWLERELSELDGVVSKSWPAGRTRVAYVVEDRVQPHIRRLYLWDVASPEPTPVPGAESLDLANAYLNEPFVLADQGTSMHRTGLLFRTDTLERVAVIPYVGTPMWFPGGWGIIMGRLVPTDPPLTEWSLKGTVDLALYNVTSGQVETLIRGTRDHYILPKEWRTPTALVYRKIPIGGRGAEELITFDLLSR